MQERFARVADDLELCFETFGDPAAPAFLLIMGLGTQMLGWHAGLCERLATRGFHVIRFDNRDTGRSTQLRHLPAPSLWQLLRRDRRAAAYSLGDMAGDCAGLLDHLEIDAAHVAGASMGGMIAQAMAIERRERVLSLASLMSSTGARRIGRPALSLYPIFASRPAPTRAAAIDRSVRTFTRIGSTGYEIDEAELRAMIELGFERASGGAGTSRQLAAVLTAPDRTPALRRLDLPTVVIHGTADRLVNPSGGRATAAAVPGAELVEIDGMGHDLPRGAWSLLLDALVANAARAAVASAG